MAFQSPCLRCRALTRDGSYCRACKPRPASPGRLAGRAGVELRRRVRALYGNACGRCGATGPLEVHHLDHDHRNNEISNLIPLCRSCHGRAGARPH